MDQHTRAMHFVLYFNAIEVLDELKSMPQDDVVTALKEIGKRYEELLPYLLLTAHINAMKEAIEATKALMENKIAPKGDYEAQRDIRIDFFNAICAVQSAVMYIRKAYPNYEAQFSLACLFCEAYLLRRLILLRSATLTY